ncbi:uncharacterized protein LOC144704707 [Wolffia australiana]
MAVPRSVKGHKQKPRSPLLMPLVCALALVICWLFFYSSSFRISSSPVSGSDSKALSGDLQSKLFDSKYLYWGNGIDCPGKHCDSCAGLGHQESSLRCALEEAMFLKRVFVMPSRMCVNPIHNEKGILTKSVSTDSEERWGENYCAMDSLYDMDLISKTVPVILDNSKSWNYVISTGMKLGDRGLIHVEGVSRFKLNENNHYKNALVINRTASPLAWFMECKDRTNRSSILLPYSFLPSMAAQKLRDAADEIKSILGDYDAIHVRRGDRIKTRKDRFGVDRSLHPHLDRDTRPEFIQRRIEKWVPPGRTLFIASNEKTPGFFSPLSSRYKIAFASNFTRIVESVIENNYQLFMIERLVMAGARTLIRTFKEDQTDLSLTDDPKKNTKNWSKPVYTLEEDGTR